MERQYKKLVSEFEIQTGFITKQEKTIFNSYKEVLEDIKQFSKENLTKISNDKISFSFNTEDGKITHFYYFNETKEISVSYERLHVWSEVE